MILSGWKGKLAVGLAASVGLGAIGAGVAQVAERSGLMFPGDVQLAERAMAQNNLKQLGADFLPHSQKTIEDLGGDVKQSELDRLGRAATLEDAEKLAEKAGQGARTHWFDVTNGTQRGWAFRSAEGRGDGLSQKGAPADGRGGDVAKAGDRHMFIQNGGPAAGTTYYKESGPAVSLDGKFQASIT